jgi:hypothetical protein
MNDSILAGRLGITVSKEFSPCCGDMMLKWFPRMAGDRKECTYCGNKLNAVKAQDFQDSQYTGQCLEMSGFLAKSREVHLQQIWFSKSTFKSADVCSQWLMTKCIPISHCEESDTFYCFKGTDCVPGSERVIYVSKGILGVVGLEKDAMGASDFTSGGSLAPAQGDETTTDESTESKEETTEKSLESLVAKFFPE